VYFAVQIPNVTLLKIPTARHPVKVGLSDAYYIDRPSNTGTSYRQLHTHYPQIFFTVV